ncbi:MAG: class I SAM-dependent methyltransferase [Candidatus Jettenia caeni]|nr:MAG: class I SAM-dependent methyltransferase [Candidatus Jettenia caeni]
MQILLVDNQIETDVNLSHLMQHLKNEYGKENVTGLKYIQDAKMCFKYDDKSIDFIFLDIEFGCTGNNIGLEFLEEIRKTDPYIPVCIITKHDDINRAFKSGRSLASFYITKKDLCNKFNVIDDWIKKSNDEVRFGYDRSLMKSINSKLAEDYDKIEYSKPGTIAFLYWEDEVIKKALKMTGDELGNFQSLKILDVACGTGRYEVLLHKAQKELGIKVDIAAMDFAGKMLIKAREKLEDIGVYVEPFKTGLCHIKLQRGFAEKIPFPDKEFDLVIFGFGVPSYTRFNYSIPEANRVLKSGGYAIFTVYNKSSLFNNYRKYFDKRIDECPLASWIKFEHFSNSEDQGIYKLVPQGCEEAAIEIQTFTKNELKDILNRFHFQAIKIETFPSLYSILPVKNIKAWSREDDRKVLNVHNFPCNYKPPYGEPAPFSYELYEIDKEHSKEQDCGFYITAIVKKVEDV